MSNAAVLDNIIPYLDKINYPTKQLGKTIMIQCPACQSEPFSAQKIPNAAKISCFKCRVNMSLIDIVKYTNPKYELSTDEEIVQYIKTLLGLNVITEQDEQDIKRALAFYHECGFSLVPVAPNAKVPIERNWPKCQHKSIEEWEQWVFNKTNVGVNCGEISGVTVIDIDSEEVYQQYKAMLNPTLIQKSTRGYHYFYQYEAELNTANGLVPHFDVANNEHQVVIYPSIVDGVQRKFTNLVAPEKMSNELLEFIKTQQAKTPARKQLAVDDAIVDDIKCENIQLKNLDGVCNSTWIKLGGILRKELNAGQTAWVLQLLNKKLLEKPMDFKSITAMCQQIEKYCHQDDNELAHKIVDYLMAAESAPAAEIEVGIFGERPRGENKKKFSKTLVDLIKAKKIRRTNKEYKLRSQTDWKEDFISAAKPLEFKVPYFNDVANFHWGEHILIGGVKGSGKSTLVMNIIKRLVVQGVKPYLIELEPAKKFLRTGMRLGLVEGDFYWSCIDPMEAEIPQNSVIVIDWLLPKDYAKTDQMFYDINQKLLETNSFMIAFMQTRPKSNEWYAKDLVEFFPSLTARFILDDYYISRDTSKFVIDKVNDPKKPRIWEIPLIYNDETYELKLVDEVNKEREVSNG